MNRRNFLRSMLGVAAATALPSEVWPFKKIFLPLAPRIALSIASIQAIELEVFAKGIPDLLFAPTSFYSLLKKRVPVSTHPFRIPLIWMPNADQAEAITAKQAQGIDVQAAIDALV